MLEALHRYTHLSYTLLVGLTFIYTEEFLKAIRSWLDEEGLRQLEITFLKNPEAGAVIQGTNGLRKARFALAQAGKSGGLRILYVLIEQSVYFIWVFPKNKKVNITAAERQRFAVVVQRIKEVHRGKS